MLTFLSRRRILAWLACAPACAALFCAKVASAQAPATYPVHGVVLNRITQEPIARALVDGQTDSALTDSGGRFELNLPLETNQIFVRRPGFTQRGQGVTHLVKLTANTPDLTFYLRPQATITGHISLSTGDDPDGIRFTAYRLQLTEGREQWLNAGIVTTNSEGIFRLTSIDAPASYVLCSIPSQDHNQDQNPDQNQDSNGPAKRSLRVFGYSSVCYPGPIFSSATRSAANQLTVTPGQQADFELTLTRQPFYPVSIAVQNAPQGQGNGIQILDESGRFLDFPTRWNAQQGVAEVDLPNGNYFAEAFFRGQTFSYGRVDFHVASRPLGLNMVIHPLRPIPVEIRKNFTEKSATEEPMEERFARGAGLNLNLSPADSMAANRYGGGLQPVEGSSSGTQFEIEGMAPGRYWVETYPFEGYISSITSGGVDLSREPLVVGAGSTTAPIQVTLRNDVGSIQCTVNPPSDSESTNPSQAGEVSFTFVYAIPVSRTPSQFRPVSGQGPGQVTIPNLAPGTYRVVAFDHYRQIDLSDAQGLERLTANAQTVTVTPGSSASVQVDLIHTGDSDSADANELTVLD
jgi:hypothetical protein